MQKIRKLNEINEIEDAIGVRTTAYRKLQQEQTKFYVLNFHREIDISNLIKE